MAYENELLTINEVARIARLSRPTIYRWMSDGLLKYSEMPRGTRRIKVRDAAEAFNLSVDEIVEIVGLREKIARLDN